MRFSDLTTRYEFPPSALALDGETVARYLAATGDDNDIYWRNGAPHIVPPLAVAALSLRGMAENLALEPGALHTGQELTFRRPITVGERLTTQARVGGSSKRRGMTVLAIDITVVDDMGEEALSGRMNLLVPGEGVDGAHIPLPGGAAVHADLAQTVSVAYRPLSHGEIVAGMALGLLERTPSGDIVDAYAVASGDYNPIHVDPDFAARSQFGGTIAHGMLVLSYLSTLLTRSFGMRWINTGALKVRFRSPAPVGLPVTARGVIERVERGDGVQYAVCAVIVENALADALITGEARVHIPEE